MLKRQPPTDEVVVRRELAVDSVEPPQVLLSRLVGLLERLRGCTTAGGEPLHASRHRRGDEDAEHVGAALESEGSCMRDDHDVPLVGSPADRIADQLPDTLRRLESMEVDFELAAGLARFRHGNCLGVELARPGRGDDDPVVDVPKPESFREQLADLPPSGTVGMREANDWCRHRSSPCLWTTRSGR